MDGVSLIRIFHGPSIDSASYFYQVPANFEKNRKMLNRYLAEAIFANKALLVEGPSELLLFERVLSTINPFYEVDGIYILSVEGVGFSQYCKILNALKIKWIVKTDNDLRRPRGKSDYVAYGFQRCNKIIGKETLPIQSYPDDSIANKRTLYAENKEALDDIRANCGIFLSVVDLENDLDEVLHNNLCEIIYVFLTIFLYLLKCPQSLILSALRAFCFCGKPHISRSIFLYFRYQAWLKSW